LGRAKADSPSLCDASKHPIPLTELAATAFRDQMKLAGEGQFLFPSDLNSAGHHTTFKTAWAASLRRANVPYFRVYDLRSTNATRLSAGGVADEWVTQLMRQDDAQVFKKYSQMKLQMKREALQKMIVGLTKRFWYRRLMPRVLVQFWYSWDSKMDFGRILNRSEI
jgi:integrase